VRPTHFDTIGCVAVFDDQSLRCPPGHCDSGLACFGGHAKFFGIALYQLTFFHLDRVIFNRKGSFSDSTRLRVPPKILAVYSVLNTR
jgi:hypothetical protein